MIRTGRGNGFRVIATSALAALAGFASPVAAQGTLPKDASWTLEGGEGGYCISYTGEEVMEAQEYAARLKDTLEKLRCEVIIEPGRYISGPSGLLLVSVL